ncbi:MAG: ATP-binding cassette domain-containing protein [Clostridia bacterium]|nr:ATP-binding cassette domain-containing protein [Clostridia bacterium]
MGVLPLAGKPFSKLSGGQQQRVLLARARCAAERLLLLDEPTAGLDPRGTEELYETVEQLNREGITVIMITHDLPAVARYATSVLSMGEEPTFYPSVRAYLEDAALTAEEDRHE